MLKVELQKILKTTFGLFVFSIGEYFTILANIGLTPWDSLAMGVSYHIQMTFGQVHVAIALIIIAIDLLMKEKIGIGTLLDALLVGTFCDMWMAIFKSEGAQNKIAGVAFIVVGLLIMAVGQVFYMSGGLSCGPRDTLLIAVGKRLPKVKIGYVDIGMKVVLIIVSFAIGGPIGIGTLIAMIGMGLAMQIVYSMFKFEPRDIVHEGFMQTVKNMLDKPNM